MLNKNQKFIIGKTIYIIMSKEICLVCNGKGRQRLIGYKKRITCKICKGKGWIITDKKKTPTKAGVN
jgi:DnaJ-class molecular chaperone